MRETDLTRRSFIQRSAFVSVAAIGTSQLLAGCGGGQTGGETGGDQAAALDCSDTTALTPEQVQTRTSLVYVEKSTTEGKMCSNCQQYQAPAEAGACGTCLVVPGTINPDGHCTAWVEKTT